MPGIDTAAPDRTLNSSGLSAEPKLLPVSCSTAAMPARASSHSDSGQLSPCSKKCSQAAVVMVKPGGTGSPRLVISARPAPFPPRTAFMVRSPSAAPPPKR